MHRSLISSLYLAAVALALGIIGLYGGLAYLHHVAPSDATLRLWAVIFDLILACWIIEDSRGRDNICRPFCFGFLLLTFLWPYTLYYLVKTRGGAGLAWIAGGFALVMAGGCAPLLFKAAG